MLFNSSDFKAREIGAYILCPDGSVRLAESREEWTAQYETHSNTRIVAQDDIRENTFVSTVFLGIDHSFNGGEPVLFETMVRINGEWSDALIQRYTTIADARAGHERIVALLMNPDTA